MIDSSVLIAIERGSVDLESRIAGLEDEELALASITASELLHGIHRALKTEIRARREAWVEAILGSFPILPFDLLAARLHASTGAELAQRGINVGAHDLIIGATALSRGLKVITRDERSFPRMPGLEVLVW